jgi:cation diffusion facilitator CzcD-associated flavoprotein CzcO
MSSTTPDFEVLIIGSGFGGLCVAIRLEQAGFPSYVVLESGPDVGGTWRVNTYPGCACDIPSHLYSYSFELNPDWSRMYPTQPEIWKYLQHCAKKYRVLPNIRFNSEVREVSYDEAAHLWRVRTRTGDAYTARIVVSAMGGLSRISCPRITGLEHFRGRVFHSAEWDHGAELKGKRIGVIGTGASSIQIVPRIAPEAGRLHVFQRTPPWIVPKLDRNILAAERFLFRRLPGYMRLFRSLLYLRQEMVGLGYTVNPKYMRLLERLSRRHLRRSVRDPALRQKLTPVYQIGCKRVLLSNDYLKTLCRPNVEVVSEAIAEMREGSVVTVDGQEREVDALIFCTGFRTTDLLSPVHFSGRNGVALNDAWRSGAEAFRGFTVAGFPNLFLLIGPNSRVGYNSIVFMIEAQTHYIIECLRLMQRNGASSIEARREEQVRFNERLQQRMGRTVYASGCKSWYLDESGKGTILWPGLSSQYWKDTRRLTPAEYILGTVLEKDVSAPLLS